MSRATALERMADFYATRVPTSAKSEQEYASILTAMHDHPQAKRDVRRVTDDSGDDVLANGSFSEAFAQLYAGFCFCPWGPKPRGGGGKGETCGRDSCEACKRRDQMWGRLKALLAQRGAGDDSDEELLSCREY